MSTRPLKNLPILLLQCFFLAVFWLGSNPTNVQAQELKKVIDSRSADLENRVIEWRRHIHQNPELSNREYKNS